MQLQPRAARLNTLSRPAPVDLRYSTGTGRLGADGLSLQGKLDWLHLGLGALEVQDMRLGRECSEGAELPALWTPRAADVGCGASAAQRDRALGCVSSPVLTLTGL